MCFIIICSLCACAQPGVKSARSCSSGSEVTRYTHLVLGHGVELRGEGAVVCVVEQRAALLEALGDEGGLQLLVALLVTCNSNTVTISATRK